MRHLVLAIVCILTCAARADSPPVSATGDDTAILRILLHCDPKADRYDILSDIPLQADASRVPSKWRLGELNAEISRRNMLRLRWPELSDCANARVVDNARIEAIFDSQIRVPASWEPFRTEFPGARGLQRVSLPAYTTDGRRAVVFSDFTCDSLCGSGFVYEFRKTARGWRLARRTGTWIS